MRVKQIYKFSKCEVVKNLRNVKKQPWILINLLEKFNETRYNIKVSEKIHFK